MKALIRSLLLLSLAAAPLASRAENLAISGDTIYTMSGLAIHNGVVLVRDGKIEAVGAADIVKIPAD